MTGNAYETETDLARTAWSALNEVCFDGELEMPLIDVVEGGWPSDGALASFMHVNFHIDDSAMPGCEGGGVRVIRGMILIITPMRRYQKNEPKVSQTANHDQQLSGSG